MCPDGGRAAGPGRQLLENACGLLADRDLRPAVDPAVRSGSHLPTGPASRFQLLTSTYKSLVVCRHRRVGRRRIHTGRRAAEGLPCPARQSDTGKHCGLSPRKACRPIARSHSVLSS
jgi:hypothetical protein